MVILEIPCNKRWNIIVTFENVSQFSTQRSNGNKHDKILFLDSRQHYHIIKSTTQHRNRHCLYISWAINTTTMFQRSSAKIKNQFYLSIGRNQFRNWFHCLESAYISIQLDRTLDTFHCIKFPSLVSRVTISVFLLRGCEDEVDVMFVKVDHEERNEMTSCGVVIFIRESSSWNQSWREFPAAGCANFTRMKERKERRDFTRPMFIIID